MKVILEPGKKNGRKASGIQRENMVFISQLFKKNEDSLHVAHPANSCSVVARLRALLAKLRVFKP